MNHLHPSLTLKRIATKLRATLAITGLCSLMCCSSGTLAKPYLTLKLGRSYTGNWQVAGSVHLGYSLMKYLSAEGVYAEYAAQNNILLAQAKVIIPLSSLLTGITPFNLYGLLGGGWVEQSGQNSIAATYGIGAQSMLTSKLGLSFSWQHLNHTEKTSSYNFFGLGTSIYF